MENKKTFLNDQFYQKPICSQTELAKHWGVANSTIINYEKAGIIKRLEEFDIKKDSVMYSVKQVMLVEGSNENLDEIEYWQLKREHKKLKKENEDFKKALAGVRNLVNFI